MYSICKIYFFIHFVLYTIFSSYNGKKRVWFLCILWEYKYDTQNHLCAAEAIFCCPTENSRPRSLLSVKRCDVQKGKGISKKTARCHITLEKSSKNYIRCENEPSQAAIHSVPPPTSSAVICGLKPFENVLSDLRRIQHEAGQ